MADLLKLQALAATEIAAACAALANGGSTRAWEQAMERIVTRTHAAAYIAATAERLGITPDPALISQARLSRVERNEIKAAVQAQLTYLRRFAGLVRDGDLSPAYVAARAAKYAGAARGTYEQQRWGGWELPFYPTQGSECMTNCRCAWEVVDNGDGTGTATWRMGAVEHCPTCARRAGGNPYAVQRRA